MGSNRRLALVGLALILGCGSPKTQVVEPVPVDKQREASIKNLQSEDPRERMFAVAVLANMGESSKELLPEIKKLENDPEAMVRNAAKDAVKKIEKGG